MISGRMPCDGVLYEQKMGSFDLVSDSLRESKTALRMTACFFVELFLAFDQEPRQFLQSRRARAKFV